MTSRATRLLFLCIMTFMTALSAGDAPQAPTPANDAQTPALQSARAAGYDAESKIMELERQSDQLIKEAKIQNQKNQQSGGLDQAKESEFRARITRIQQESRVAKRTIAEGQNADEPEKSAFESGMADARAGKPRPTVAGDAATAGANPNDSLKRARAKGHAIGLEMVASEQKTKELLNDAAEMERAGNTTRLRLIRSEINKLLAEKTTREKAGLEYATGLTQAERDAYIEGIQAAQAGK